MPCMLRSSAVSRLSSGSGFARGVGGDGREAERGRRTPADAVRAAAWPRCAAFASGVLQLPAQAHQPRQQQHEHDDDQQHHRDRPRRRRRSTCPRRSTAHCASAPRPAARGSCPPPPARSGSRSAASPRRAGRCAYSSTRSNGRLAHAVHAHRGEDQDAGVERSGFGIFSSLTHRPTSGRFSTSSITLPMYSDAISAHTSAAFLSNSCGPGWMP